ncbi:hypothetical protein [Variovorax sp. PAMC 28711]|uniref:hypothetical protein n=1 Tax=Variovorax sp. PAMC 28711 TaxID=1795631 RepID=UPI00078E4DEC|nr:hypothetical protein [Variovorax sp. PAMC 28711]AMM25780.1 hypothetical protein AX767_16525 [Variovorax sp. PAMC 28711]
MTMQTDADRTALKARAPARDPEPACLPAVLAAIGAAVALAAVVWTTYDAFDESGFDFRAAVVQPVLSALGLAPSPGAGPK